MMTSHFATYYDGVTSRRREVELSLHPDGLALFERGGGRIETWPYASIRRIEGLPGPGLVVTRISEPASSAEPRLEISDLDFASNLAARAPLTLTKGLSEKRERRAVVLWALAAAASVLAVVYFGLPAIASRLAVLVPPSLEIKLGESIDGQVRSMLSDSPMKACVNPEGARALKEIVDRYEQAAQLHVPLSVVVLDHRLVNAFALPGGRIYIFRGLIDRAKSADELAGVLGHEIGHIRHRHGLRSAIQAGGLGFVLGTVFGDFAGGTAIVLGSRALIQSSFSRDAEREADLFGVDLMLKTAGDPMGLARFFQDFNAADPGAFAWLASHPANAERERAIREAVGQARARGPALSAMQWTALRSICQKTE
jgi:predicted Zn-dependent protease